MPPRSGIGEAILFHLARPDADLVLDQQAGAAPDDQGLALMSTGTSDWLLIQAAFAGLIRAMNSRQRPWASEMSRRNTGS